MQKVVARGEAVYVCTVCNRKLRVPTNRKGMDVLVNCILTAGCRGKMNKVHQLRDINNTPTLTPSVGGVLDWVQRKSLYTHNQEVASQTWNINHNLDGNPIIHTYVNAPTQVGVQLVAGEPQDTILIDSNNTQLIFDRAQTGIAQLIALSSQNTINSPNAVITPTDIANTQISTNSGLITLGTLLSDSSINLTISYNITGQSPIDIIYNNLDNIPSISSPWAGIQRVFVNGKRYFTRSIDLTNHINAFTHFLSGEIPPQGAVVNIKLINNSIPNPGEVIILEAEAPFDPTDRIYDQYVDFSGETAASANVIYKYGRFYVLPAGNRQTYPYIVVV
ncbi:hypothetical protein M0R04_06945 [Candidatus Dojkabacteria bacterium]|jgi:hypothetical protein|nr:hypothetical protein [Candidatus Dojkabacteria bacterium]